MGKYIKCPRCELNYILEEDDYCPVCKAEMKIEGYTLLEEEEEELLCPVCKLNFLEDGEKVCGECKRKKAEKVLPDEDFDVIPLKEEIEEEPEIIADEEDIETLPIEDEFVEDLDENIGEAGFYEIDPEEEEEIIEAETPEEDDFEEDFEEALIDFDEDDFEEEDDEEDLEDEEF